MKNFKNPNPRPLENVLFQLFANRTDTFAVQKKDGTYRRVGKPVTEEVLKQHLTGKKTIGCYQINPADNSVKWICFDIDPERITEATEVAAKIAEQAKKSFGDTAVLLEASRHPDPSHHVWIFFNPSIPASVAKLAGETILENLHLEELGIELFPKQETIKDGFGNLVKLPLGVHREHNKRSRFLDSALKPLPDSCVLKVQPCRMREAVIQSILAEVKQRAKKTKDAEQKNKGIKYRGNDPPCIQNLRKGVEEGNRNEAGIHLASYWLNFRKIRPDNVWALLKGWDAKNKPPMKLKELRSIMQSAVKGGYNYGCSNPFLQRFCTGNRDCGLFHFATKITIDEFSFVLEETDGKWQIQSYRKGRELGSKLHARARDTRSGEAGTWKRSGENSRENDQRVRESIYTATNRRKKRRSIHTIC